MEDKEYIDISAIKEVIMNTPLIDTLRFFGMIALPIVVPYATKRIFKSFSLKMDYKPKNIASIEVPPSLIDENPKIDNEEILKKQYYRDILKFIDVIKRNFKESDLKNFYHNINGLVIINSEDVKNSYEGEYNPRENQMEIYEYSPMAIFHELFHMASSIKHGDVYFTGFKQYKSGDVIGKGLNEGYTQLLTERYFDVEEGKSYPYQVDIMRHIETIVGREKMESLYLNADLLGLTRELNRYMSNEEIMRFIADMDFLQTNLTDKKKTHKENQLIKTCFKRINRFLIICYARKVRENTIENIFGIDTGALETLRFILEDVPKSIRIMGKKYEVLDDKDIGEYLHDAYETEEIEEEKKERL